jgi:hypothetical protein
MALCLHIGPHSFFGNGGEVQRHRVVWVLGIFSSRTNWNPPSPPCNRVCPPGGYKEMSSILAVQLSPRIWAQMRGEGGSCGVSANVCSFTMDEWTIKTPNPICRLFFKIDLLTEFAALCLTDFIDWRYIHSYQHLLVFSTQLVNCCPHGRTILVFTVSPLSSLWPLPPPLPKLTVQYIYTDSVSLGGGWLVL